MEGVLSVSELNIQVKSLLEATFLQVAVRGEVSNLTYHTSGHIYLTLKDSSSSIRAVLFKGNASRLKFRLENGMDVTLYGGLGVYTPRGEYQIIAQNAEPTGVGSLALAFEQLKKELAALGYFDPAHKKPLPPFPSTIALLTSATGAALQDMLRVATKRWPLVKIIGLNTLVQGEGAKESIAKNIAYADSLGVDVIVVGRGGGSLEDLWAFNERIVAEAIYHAKTPIVSAVGHEVDVVISDFVADLRAPTPSSAMELILPDCSEWLIRLDGFLDEFRRAFNRILQKRESELKSLQDSLDRLSLAARLKERESRIKELLSSLNQAMRHQLRRQESQLEPWRGRFEGAWEMLWRFKTQEVAGYIERYKEADPLKWCHKGYAQVVSHKEVKTLEALERDEVFELLDGKWRVQAKVLEKEKMGIRDV